MSSAFMCVTNGRAAAPPASVWSIGRLDFEESALVELAAQARDDARAHLEDLEGLGVGPHVDVALAVADLDILQAGVLFGGRHQALGAGAHARGPHRDLAGAVLTSGPRDDHSRRGR
jgi:hypothetical protein